MEQPTLELFFDLVFVFGITQLVSLFEDDPTVVGFLKAALILAMLWWTWSPVHVDNKLDRYRRSIDPVLSTCFYGSCVAVVVGSASSVCRRWSLVCFAVLSGSYRRAWALLAWS